MRIESNNGEVKITDGMTVTATGAAIGSFTAFSTQFPEQRLTTGCHYVDPSNGKVWCSLGNSCPICNPAR